MRSYNKSALRMTGCQPVEAIHQGQQAGSLLYATSQISPQNSAQMSASPVGADLNFRYGPVGHFRNLYHREALDIQQRQHQAILRAQACQQLDGQVS